MNINDIFKVKNLFETNLLFKISYVKLLQALQNNDNSYKIVLSILNDYLENNNILFILSKELIKIIEKNLNDIIDCVTVESAFNLLIYEK